MQATDLTIGQKEDRLSGSWNHREQNPLLGGVPWGCAKAVVAQSPAAPAPSSMPPALTWLSPSDCGSPIVTHQHCATDPLLTRTPFSTLDFLRASQTGLKKTQTVCPASFWAPGKLWSVQHVTAVLSLQSSLKTRAPGARVSRQQGEPKPFTARSIPPHSPPDLVYVEDDP